MTISRLALGWTRWSVILLALSQPGPAQTHARAPAPQRPAQGDTAGQYRNLLIGNVLEYPTGSLPYTAYLPIQWDKGPPPGHCLRIFPPSNTYEARFIWFPCYVDPVKMPIPERLP